MQYSNLLHEAEHHGISIYEMPMTQGIKGLYNDKIVWINKHLPTFTEKTCIVAEELGHYYTSVGNVLDQTKLSNRKQEKLARTWAYQKLIPLRLIVQAYKKGASNRYELAEFLGVTEGFLDSALERYREKYGTYAVVDGYTLCFDPLGIVD